jgi:hypothetical protein
VPGLLAAIWLLGLFAAAPALRTDARYEFPDRLRDALILGVAIPFVLGFVHTLYPAACWFALMLCAAVAYARGAKSQRPRERATRIPYVTIVALAAVAWPQLMRPLLDGDSLSYHLPNAAAWVQAHSLWTTAPRYWWYPPASELFASALYATSGPFALPWSGFGALALLGFRIYAWSRELKAPPLLADALAAATITAYPLATQSGTLQNDVWLAAFWLESLWQLRATPATGAALRTLAVTALLKPQGWLLAFGALLAYRARWALWFAAAAPFGVWLLHDAILWRRAIVPPASTMYASDFGSTILAHGIPGIALLVRVAVVVSPWALLAILAALAGAAIARRDRRLGWAACGAALLFLVVPFGYATAVAQLATGASLRFAAPAIAAGAVILARPARRIESLATILLVASTLFGLWQVAATFWNDAPTRTVLAVAPLAVAVVWLALRYRARWVMVLGFAAAAVAADVVAGLHAVDFVTDAFRVDNRSSGLYAWLAARRPAAVGGVGLAIGTVNLLAPATRTVELPEADACAAARRRRVALAAVAENGRSAEYNAARLRAARACGPVLYDDGIAVVALPYSVSGGMPEDGRSRK